MRSFSPTKWLYRSPWLVLLLWSVGLSMPAWAQPAPIQFFDHFDTDTIASGEWTAQETNSGHDIANSHLRQFLLASPQQFFFESLVQRPAGLQGNFLTQYVVMARMRKTQPISNQGPGFYELRFLDNQGFPLTALQVTDNGIQSVFSGFGGIRSPRVCISSKAVLRLAATSSGSSGSSTWP